MSERKFTQDNVTWGSRPSPADERFIPIYSAQPNVTLRLVVVCQQAVSATTHYMDGRTIPCIGKEAGCDGCKDGRSCRVKTYLGCWESVFSRLAMLEVTSEGLANCNVALLAESAQLRGMRARAYRIGKARNAPMRCELDPPVAGEVLPDEFDIRTALLRVWNGKHRQS